MPRKLYSLKSRHQGFALVVAILLMAFILVLLLSLSSLTRLEITTLTLQRSMQEAKKNAELGLAVALGNLQQLLGPDQRVTATAALLDEDQLGTRYWTGVWDASSWDPQDPDAHRFLGWLVSGDRTVLGTKEAYRTAANDTVELLGADGADAYAVRVPQVELEVGGGALPSGSYAYWIADESQKVKVNLEDPYQRQKQTQAGREKARVFVPHAFAIGMDERLEGVDIWNPDNWGRWSRIYELATLPLHDAVFTPLLSPGDSRAETFHNYTTEGHGLLADTQKGGLRKNLTWGLRDKTTFDSELGGRRVLEQNEVAAAWLDGAKFFTPRWEVFRDYALLPETFTGLKTPTFTIDSKARGLVDSNATETDTSVLSGYYYSEPDGIAKIAARLTPGSTEALLEPQYGDIEPILVRCSLFFRLSTEAETTAEGIRYRVYLDATPRFTLWNPYNVTMKLSGIYVLQVQLKPEFTLSKLGDPNPLFTGALRTIANAERDYLWLEVDMGKLPLQDQIVEPGALRVFGMQSIEQARVTGQSGRRRVIQNLAPYHAEKAGIRFDITPLMDADGRQVEVGDQIAITWDTDAAYRNPNPSQTAWIRLSKNETNGNRFLLQNIDSFGLDAFGGTPTQEWFAASELESIALELGGYDLHLKHAGETEGGVPVVAAFNPRAYYSTLLAENYTDGKPHNWAVQTLDLEPLYRNFEDTPFGYMLRGEWGSGLDGSGRLNVVLYDLPQVFPQSLAEFRYANTGTFATFPAHAVGNSWANPHLGAAYAAGKSGGKTQMDQSWLLNTALWDRYFLSSYPVDNSGEATLARLPNSRLFALDGSVTKAQLESYAGAATHLGIDGAFNVNSTSEKAWTALLGSLKAPNVDVYTVKKGSASTDFDRSFFRFTRLLTGNASNSPEWYQGHWNLDEAEVRALAKEIVQEVRERGPFMNLADFVNRRLVNDESGRVGALQAAIDRSGVNDTFVTGYNLKPADASFPVAGNAPATQAAGMTGHLSQADLLAALGPVITTRGDTFRIIVRGQGTRTTDGQEPSSAYLQAIVQRMPEYLDPADSPEVEPSALVSEVNRQLGRRFRVVQFEWLNTPPL